MNRKTSHLVTSFIVFFLLSELFAYSGNTILIRDAKIVPVIGKTLDKGCLLIENGKIIKIAVEIPSPPDADVIDARGMSVYPGLVALVTAIGVTGHPGAGDDMDEKGVSTPQMDPFDALNPEDETIEVARVGGVTTVMTIAGTHNAISGKAIVLNLEGDLAEDLVIKRYAAQLFNIGATTHEKYPMTLPGVISLIRDKLNQTKSYIENKKRASQKPQDKANKGTRIMQMPFENDAEMEALIPVVQGEVPALLLTANEVTIHNAIQIIKEYNIKGIIRATSDILKFADQLSRDKIPVIWAGTTTIPQPWEPFDLNYHTASVLESKGILFALDQVSWGPSMNRSVRNLPMPAGISIAHGLSEEEAIKAITINPAKILGVDDQVGSLEVGKTANVVIWSGSPIQMRSRVQEVIINGKRIPLKSLQTRLRDKFDKIVRERLRKRGSDSR
jgi:imidazolonepropionase-like amidohydrolase